MFRRLSMLSLLAALCLATPQFAAADAYRNVDTASAQDIIDGMATKGVRGATNLLTGWVELPKQIYMTSEKEGWQQGVVVGPLKGIGMAVVRTVSGAGELLTFFIAYPGFFDPWIEPKYVWMKE